MKTSRDLFLAILSLDSYNRGYGVNIEGLAIPEFNPDGSKRTTVQLGMADLSNDSVALLGPIAEAAGFYAIAYELPAGYVEDLSGTVISYRGDSIFDFFNSWLRNAIRWHWRSGNRSFWAG